VSTLGRTQNFADGEATMAEVGIASVAATAAGATYVSPTFVLQPGSQGE
jgi:hypothetical protein